MVGLLLLVLIFSLQWPFSRMTAQTYSLEVVAAILYCRYYHVYTVGICRDLFGPFRRVVPWLLGLTHHFRPPAVVLLCKKRGTHELR